MHFGGNQLTVTAAHSAIGICPEAIVLKWGVCLYVCMYVRSVHSNFFIAHLLSVKSFNAKFKCFQPIIVMYHFVTKCKMP